MILIIIVIWKLIQLSKNTKIISHKRLLVSPVTMDDVTSGFNLEDNVVKMAYDGDFKTAFKFIENYKNKPQSGTLQAKKTQLRYSI